ncbi:hypothetical protein ACJJTC_016569 [Scirpophaga incertulas]
MRAAGVPRPRRSAAWAWLAVFTALGRTTAYTDTEEFLSDLDKPVPWSHIQHRLLYSIGSGWKVKKIERRQNEKLLETDSIAGSPSSRTALLPYGTGSYQLSKHENAISCY